MRVFTPPVCFSPLPFREKNGRGYSHHRSAFPSPFQGEERGEGIHTTGLPSPLPFREKNGARIFTPPVCFSPLPCREKNGVRVFTPPVCLSPSPFQGEGRGEGKSLRKFTSISSSTASSFCQSSLFQNRITIQPFSLSQAVRRRS